MGEHIMEDENNVFSNQQRIVIIGAGPTAIGALYRIKQLEENGLIKNVEVCIIEQEAEVGGLARSITDDAGFTWDLGVHVTGASRYEEFVNILEESVPSWNIIRRVVKADMGHVMEKMELENNLCEEPCSSTQNSSTSLSDFSLQNYVPYPVQNSIAYFPSALKEKCLHDLKESNEIEDKPRFDENFGQFSEKIFGRTFQSLFIRPYNEKVWTVRLEEMNCKWIEGRVPRIDKNDICRRCTLSRQQLIEEDAAQISYFRYPADMPGIGYMWKKIVAEKFSDTIFHLQRKVTKIDVQNKKIFTESVGNRTSLNVNNNEFTNECFSYTQLISTVPLTELGKLTGLSANIPLQFSKVILVGVGLKLPRSNLATQLSWAYYPRMETIFYRCTILSNFSTALVPDSSRYWSVLCEIGMQSNELVKDRDAILRKTIQDLIAVNMIENKSQVHSTWFKVLHHGYPIPTLNRDVTLKEINATLESYDIYSRGRFGGWRYEISNQDHSFECGLQLANRILLGIPESLYNI